jgi:hypothetical protein
MAATLRDFGYTVCKADPDVWMRAKTKPDGLQYWSCVLGYTDDLLVVDHKLLVRKAFLESWYTLKPGSINETCTLEPKSVSFESMVQRIWISLAGLCQWRLM